MLRLNLILRRKNDNLVLSVPLWFRVIFLIFAGFIFLGIFTVSQDSEHSSFVLPFIIATICIIASLYEESWIFNKTEKQVFSKNGLAFLFKKKSYSFSEISSIEIYSFLRGRQAAINKSEREDTKGYQGKKKIIHKKYHQELRLNLLSGEFIIIESLDNRNIDPLLQKAKTISAFTGIDNIF